MSILKKFCTNKNPSVKTIIISFVGLIILVFISICVGAVKISFSELVDIILTDSYGASSNSNEQIFHYVRLPRTLAALLTGVALSVSGTLLQTVLNNPMCSPSIIGVNAGAGLFMIVVAAFFPASIALSPIAAFIGALVSVMVVYFIAAKAGASKLTIVLAGIAVSSLLSAFTDTVVTLVPDAKISRVDFLIGSFSGVTMANVKFAVPYIVAGLILSLVLSVDINVLSLGDSTAASLGLRVTFVRGSCLVIAALLAGSAISLGGLIGFIGLIVPHITKKIIGHDNRYLLPLSAILGGAFCLLCDILARVLFVPYELPVGIIMSLIGGPFFIYLILTRKRRTVLD